MIRRTNRKLTLEQRIARLEKALHTNVKTRRFESDNRSANFTSAEARLFKNTLDRRDDISVIECSADPDTDSWFVVVADLDGDNETDFSVYKFADGHVEAWQDDRSRNSKSYNSVRDCANDLEPYDSSLYGDAEWY